MIFSLSSRAVVDMMNGIRRDVAGVDLLMVSFFSLVQTTYVFFQSLSHFLGMMCHSLLLSQGDIQVQCQTSKATRPIIPLLHCMALVEAMLVGEATGSGLFPIVFSSDEATPRSLLNTQKLGRSIPSSTLLLTSPPPYSKSLSSAG